ncbi:MAG: hypothetical protein KY466_03020 [Gemmatimonadetes bacterium]|nr:hypothetical protein [Gemmatimonadota bacterium]
MRGQGEDHAAARGGRSTVRARNDRERRVLRAALVASALLHVLALGVLGGLLEAPQSERRPTPVPFIIEPPAGMRAVNVRPVAAGEAPSPPDPRTAPEEEEVDVRTPAPAPPTTEPGPRAADGRSAADRLAPRLIDARLWRPMVLIPREPTLADVQARIAAATELLSDSALADAEARIRATDWTVKDGDGGRWGISPGKLHLGKLTLPLPIYYVEEYDPQRDEYYDLEAQVDRTRFLESFEDRVRKIRERRERERRQRQEEEAGAVAGSGGGGP